MKRCPKCSRNFPDDNQKFCTIDGGLLVAADKPFDPNATIQGTTSRSAARSAEAAEQSTTGFRTNDRDAIDRSYGGVAKADWSNRYADVGKFASTAATATTAAASASCRHQPAAAVALPPALPCAAASAAQPPVAVPPPKKKSKLPLILGILALLLILGAGAPWPHSSL